MFPYLARLFSCSSFMGNGPPSKTRIGFTPWWRSKFTLCIQYWICLKDTSKPITFYKTRARTVTREYILKITTAKFHSLTNNWRNDNYVLVSKHELSVNEISITLPYKPNGENSRTTKFFEFGLPNILKRLKSKSPSNLNKKKIDFSGYFQQNRTIHFETRKPSF